MQLDIQTELDELKAKGLSITHAVLALNELFHTAYGLTPVAINNGDCEYYADCLAYLVPGCDGFWGDEFIGETDDPERYAYHYLTGHAGRFYDSQHPEGVDDFRKLSAFCLDFAG